MLAYQTRKPALTCLALGLFLGWIAAGLRPPTLQAGGGDRAGESILTTGPILIRYDEGSKVQIPQEALYYLDYRKGRLIGTVPSLQSLGRTARYINSFAERDLVADFKLDLDHGPRPRFLMTTGALGSYSAGWAPLYVIETTTNQVAVYRIDQQTVGISVNTRLELVEIRTLGGNPAPKPPSG